MPDTRRKVTARCRCSSTAEFAVTVSGPEPLVDLQVVAAQRLAEHADFEHGGHSPRAWWKRRTAHRSERIKRDRQALTRTRDVVAGMIQAKGGDRDRRR